MLKMEMDDPSSSSSLCGINNNNNNINRKRKFKDGFFLQKHKNPKTQEEEEEEEVIFNNDNIIQLPDDIKFLQNMRKQMIMLTNQDSIMSLSDNDDDNEKQIANVQGNSASSVNWSGATFYPSQSFEDDEFTSSSGYEQTKQSEDLFFCSHGNGNGNGNGTNNHFVLSSGRWDINNQEEGTHQKLTIDKEFEQYFSMLML